MVRIWVSVLLFGMRPTDLFGLPRQSLLLLILQLDRPLSALQRPTESACLAFQSRRVPGGIIRKSRECNLFDQTTDICRRMGDSVVDQVVWMRNGRLAGTSQKGIHRELTFLCRRQRPYLWDVHVHRSR
jgi:hypothetical protein